MSDATITVRLPKDLRDVFNRVCADNGYSSSLVIREFVKKYIDNNAQLDILKEKRSKK